VAGLRRATSGLAVASSAFVRAVVGGRAVDQLAPRGQDQVVRGRRRGGEPAPVRGGRAGALPGTQLVELGLGALRAPGSPGPEPSASASMPPVRAGRSSARPGCLEFDAVDAALAVLPVPGTCRPAPRSGRPGTPRRRARGDLRDARVSRLSTKPAFSMPSRAATASAKSVGCTPATTSAGRRHRTPRRSQHAVGPSRPGVARQRAGRPTRQPERRRGRPASVTTGRPPGSRFGRQPASRRTAVTRTAREPRPAVRRCARPGPAAP
jgi:hypothetical protein